MAAPAATPSRASEAVRPLPARSLKRSSRATAAPTTTSAAAWPTSAWPVGDDRSLPNDTPTLDRSAATWTTSPATAATSDPPSSHRDGEKEASGRNTSSPAAAAPSSTIVPASKKKRPTIASQSGGGPVETVPALLAVGGVTPMPKANDPAVTWPSVRETVRQLTV